MFHYPAINHKVVIVATSALTKLLLLGVLLIVFHSFVDLYDYDLYVRAMQNIFNGLLPWAGGVIFYYPPVGFLPAVILFPIYYVAGKGWFLLSLTLLMMMCDCITSLQVYKIGKELYSEPYAFRAALLSATALSASYFILCRLDPFIICLAMSAVAFSISKSRTTSYLLLIVGFLGKLYPIVFYPFLAIYYGDSRDPKTVSILVGGFAILCALILVGYDKFLAYSSSIYVQTVPYVTYYFLGSGDINQYSLLVTIYRGLAIIIICGLLYYAYTRPKSLRTTLSMILIALCTIILLSNYRSPQYIVWVTPLFALLVADDLIGVFGFIALQIMSFLEFPVTFLLMYTNEKYLTPFAPIFFMLLFATWGIVLFIVLENMHNGGGAVGCSIGQ